MTVVSGSMENFSRCLSPENNCRGWARSASPGTASEARLARDDEGCRYVDAWAGQVSWFRPRKADSIWLEPQGYGSSPQNGGNVGVPGAWRGLLKRQGRGAKATQAV